MFLEVTNRVLLIFWLTILDITNPARAKLASSIEMRPRDIIFVAAQPLTLYNRVLGQILTTVNLSRASLSTVGDN